MSRDDGTLKYAFDWEISSLAQVGGGEALAGGLWFFNLRSQTAKVNAPFAFIGLGIGFGGSLGGASIPDASDARRGNLSYTRLRQHIDEDCWKKDDLDGATGRITMYSAGFGVGYGLMQIDAFSLSEGVLFHPLILKGFGAGVGAVAVTTVGTWKALG